MTATSPPAADADTALIGELLDALRALLAQTDWHANPGEMVRARVAARAAIARAEARLGQPPTATPTGTAEVELEPVSQEPQL